ncbi:MAG: TetR/AcrR family transcriptional regulator [Pseudomonadota bacterium]
MARVKRTQHDRSEDTRSRLIAAARRLFAEKGFANTGTEEIVAAAGVSRGALYHQFDDKTALFLGVFENVEADMIRRVEASFPPGSAALEQVHIGCDAFLDACGEPEMRQIALTDAPSVLGWAMWREVDARYGLGLIRTVLRRLVAEGNLADAQVEPVSHLLLGAVSEAAMVTGQGNADASASVRKNLHWMIDRTLAPNKTMTDSESDPG